MDDFYWYWLCNIQGIGNQRIRKLISVFETPQQIYRATENMLSKVPGLTSNQIAAILNSRNDSTLYDQFCNLSKKRIGFLHPNSPKYPQKLKNTYDYPMGLYYKGELLDFTKPCVAIVGARNCSSYGRSIAKEFAYKFAKMGIQVISGLASGIDTAGHEGCIEGGGKTCAVLGCGVDICYPKQNINLYVEMEKVGCILSEYPPGTPPLAGQFPARNRIISGLADVVVVVEAKRKSGSLITVDQALEQNKDIMVVPGRISDALSEGCNNLIKMGAQVITSPLDIMENQSIAAFFTNTNQILNPQNAGIHNKDNAPFFQSNDELSIATEKNMVYSCLNLYPKSLDHILFETNLEVTAVGYYLLQLQIEGFVEEVSKNCYARVHLE